MTLSTKQTNRIGRRIVLVSALAQFIIFGIRLSFPTFFAEFILVEQWSSEAGSRIFSVSMVMFALGSVPGGLLLDRYGPRLVFSGGVLLLAMGLLLSGFATDINQLTITYGVIGGAGLAVIGLGPTAANIAAWVPPAQRGRAIGIAFASTGLGSLIFVPLSTALISAFDWRTAYMILGGIALGVVFPLMAFGQVRHPSQRPNQRKLKSQPAAQTSNNNILRSPIFLILMLLAFTTMGPVRSLTVHQIAYMELSGISRELASVIVGLAGFLTILAFTGWGVVSDRFGRLWAFVPGALCLIAAVGVLWMLPQSQSTPLLMTYSLLLALAEGSRSSQVTALASDAFDGRGLGFVNGAVGSMFGLGAAFSPWIVGLTFDATRSYNIGFAVVITLALLSIAAYIWVGRKPKSA